jgi:hypothetical protein
MAGVRQIRAKVQRLRADLRGLAESSVSQTKDTILQLNKEQLLEGKTALGTDITPSYLTDPYFKTKEAAQRYSAWKDKITPNPNRRSGVPNMYINGYYHNSIQIEQTGDRLVYNSPFGKAKNIDEKYPNLYGLSVPFKARYIDVLRPVFFQAITTNLNS